MVSAPTFDYIIIGAGTAGCLLANRLSADPTKRVLLIEAGGPDNYPWIHIPVGYLYCIGNPRTDWLYQTEPDPGLNGRRLRYPRGKVLGGSSSINGMIYMRGQSRDYDGWAEQCGDPSWRWEHCLPFFRQHENHHGGDNEFHGGGGEWRVEKQRLHWDVLDAFAEAARQAGIPATTDFNRGDNEGVGYFEVNQHRGWRWNTAKAFLRPACTGRANFELWTGAQVRRLLFERGDDGRLRCSGAEVATPQGLQLVQASREVVLSAGAIGSPQILQLSGIGPGALLQQHGIALRHELPGVGANLQDHLQIRSVYAVTGTTTLNTLAHSWWGKARIGLEYAFRRSGPMSMAPSQLGAFTYSLASQSQPSPGRRAELTPGRDGAAAVQGASSRAWPDLQYHVQPLSLDAFGEPLHRFDAITASVCNLKPTSRGTVHVTSPRPEDAPAIAPNYLSTAEDRHIAAESLRVTRRIVGQPAMARYAPREVKPGVQYQSDDDLARLAGDIASTIFHPVGTCRMGRADDPAAVVDPRLKLRGIDGLRVVDASVMPTITSGNTNAPTLMIAERAARWMA